jgi:hypothetical protein
MIYIFDTSSFRVIENYFPERFPSFWIQFNETISKKLILSVREVYKELEYIARKPHLLDWIKRNKDIFSIPSSEEAKFISKIFSIKHFQQLVKHENILKGMPVADPFVIAAAKIRNACVVTEESYKKKAARIPNVCEYFSITCDNMEGFMEREKWKF